MEYVPKYLYDELLTENAQLKKRIAEQEQRIVEQDQRIAEQEQRLAELQAQIDKLTKMLFGKKSGIRSRNCVFRIGAENPIVK